MTPSQFVSANLTRRQLFGAGALGLGVPALATLLRKDLAAADSAAQKPKQFGGLPDLPHHPPKVKSFIYLLQNGAPPHVDTFDYKPQMEKWHGQELPESVHKNQRLTTMTQGQKSKAVLPAFTPFQQYGECDDFAYNPAKDPVHVHDFQATVLHLLGIDHERLTYKFQGRYFRLTDVHGRVVNEFLA